MRVLDMINFSRAFDLAWERMLVILFRPFDLGKWFVVGFSAFLAGLLTGGNGVSGWYGYGNNNSTVTTTTSYGPINPYMPSNLSSLASHASGLSSVFYGGVGIFFIALILLAILAVIILFYWLGARGQFLLLDNVVRNRGAIAWPWRTYARQGNSLCLFFLLYLAIVLAALAPLTILAVVLGTPYSQQHRWPEGTALGIAVILGLVYFAVLLVSSVVLFLFRELGVPLMFRDGLSAREAFGKIWRLLVRFPGPMFLFVLLRMALFLGLIVVAVIACCLTCCVAWLPYLGTVALLPALIYIKCFTLDFLAQFGPEYDVWTVDVPAQAAQPGPAPTLPPPPG
jgi:hypothetical protein